ncbi:MAG: hypothetical protein CSA95_07990 [Bacteroidetes bacterium]|nr:MAG: hypothetical protein CSA95_07990 [Bacteroidota bacterium]PIE88216.1 MAG: hypothetical protein CSA04_03020 [Bacteroidota bacterium]
MRKFLNTLFVGLICFSAQAQVANNTPDFYHLKLQGSLAQNSISSFTQDTTGQMWFSTKEGVVRYDTKTFEIYHQNKGLRTHFTNVVYASDKGDIWASTLKGFQRYNPATDCFEPCMDERFNESNITSIKEDHTGKIWFVDFTHNRLAVVDTNRQHLQVYDVEAPDNEQIYELLFTQRGRIFLLTNFYSFLEFFPEDGRVKPLKVASPQEKSTLASYGYRRVHFFETHTGKIWIGSGHGYFDIYKPEKKQFEKFYYSKKLNSHGFLGFNEAFEDRAHTIWVGTWFGGLYRIAPDRKTISQILPDRDNPHALSNNIITAFFEDKAGYLWLGTEFAGINILKKNKKFHTITHDPSDKNSLPPAIYTYSWMDETAKLWIATDGKGLFWYDHMDLTQRHAFTFGEVKVERVFHLFESRDKTLWIGTDQGLFEYHQDDNTLRHHKHIKGNFNSLSGNNITAICEDQKGNIWTGSIWSGLTEYQRGTETYHRFPYENTQTGTREKFITDLYCNDDNQLWATTADGLYRLDLNTGVTTIYKHQPQKPNSLSTDRLNCLMAYEGELWIGTDNGGLNIFNPQTDSFRLINTEKGLPSNTIKALITDDHNKVWISTPHHLVTYHPKQQRMVVYDQSDGLESSAYIDNYGFQDLIFYRNFAVKDPRGHLHFGGNTGIYIFHPDSLPQNDYKPPVLLEEIKVNGLPRKATAHTLTLQPHENHLEFTLTVLNYTQPEKNKYACFLANYDTVWRTFNKSTYSVEYLELPPGQYTFRYKGANNDGLWNTDTPPLKITIKPHFYQTIWFPVVIIAVVVCLALAFSLYRLYIFMQLKKKKEALRYSNAYLDDESVNQLDKKLLDLLAKEKYYLEASLSLQKLAILLDTRPNYLSQVINTKHHCNFREFINGYRIVEAQELLKDPYLKIEAVAYDSGFNSLSTFNATFKKVTGMTPSKYRKKQAVS